LKLISIGNKLPYFISSKLFGNRKEFGLIPDENDLNWQEWTNSVYLDFYNSTQKTSYGKVINDAGYSVLGKIDFKGKSVLEIGPGDIPHLKLWNHLPEHLVVADIEQEMLNLSAKKLHNENFNFTTVLLSKKDLPKLPFPDDEFDIVLSFYSFEHLYPFADYFNEILRCLKRGGLVVGAIPAEGGLAWGMGRYLTSRRWLLRRTNINPDKIICWEHPTFAEEIIYTLQSHMDQIYLNFYPLKVPSIDLNLVLKFIFKKI